MKPTRSAQSTAVLRSHFTSAWAVACTSSAVCSVRTISTSFMTGAGLKKCSPMTSAGRLVAFAQSVTDRLDVVVAMIAPGLRTASTRCSTARLTAMSSATASITMSASPTDS